MDQKLSLRLGQKLVLTPTLQQAIKLLQLSKLELIEHIRQELEENPILEEIPTESPLAEPQEVPASIKEPEPTEPELKTELPQESPYQVDMDWSLYENYEGSIAQRDEEDPKEGLWYENVLSTKQSLKDYLMWQLHLTLDEEEELAIGEEIIGDIDDDGYLQARMEEIATLLSVAADRVEKVLAVVQSFDPPGIGARGVEECLSLQLKRLPEAHPLAEVIARDHLKRLENKSYQQIAQVLRKPVEEVFKAAQVIAGLEPKPGRLFSTEEPQYIIPDLYIYKDGDDYRISLNDEGLPKLRINNYYRRLLNSDSLPDNARVYINKKFSSALWLVKSIHQRQKTIFRVAESIVKFQKDFFERGIQGMKPMILKDVAEDIGVHESTVSRVTTRKYAQTPQGLLELKFFFNTGIDQDSGASMASTSVQNLIRLMVEVEDQRQPLSDQEIAAALRKKHGLVIARRTVAKYRKIIKVPPANRRRTIVSSGKLTHDEGEESRRCT